MIPQGKSAIQDPEKERDENLQVQDYQCFLKAESYPDAEYLKLVKIQANKYSNLDIENMEIEYLNSLQCTKLQLITLTKRIILTTVQSKNTEKLFTSNHSQLTEIIDHLARQITLGYNSVSYHNFTHGFQLMKILYLSLNASQTIRSHFNAEQLTLILLAALSHDIKHQGVNNAYNIQMNTAIAQQANNVAVLENMHAKTFLSILKQNPKADLLSMSDNYAQNKQMIVRLILATDMASHMNHLNALRAKRSQGQLNLNNRQDKMLLIQNLFHACDINSPCHQNFDEFASWTGLLCYEFDEQVKLEKKNNLIISSFMKYKGLSDLWKGQINFTTTFVYPLWKQISLTLPEVHKTVQIIQGTICILQKKINEENE